MRDGKPGTQIRPPLPVRSADLADLFLRISLVPSLVQIKKIHSIIPDMGKEKATGGLRPEPQKRRPYQLHNVLYTTREVFAKGGWIAAHAAMTGARRSPTVPAPPHSPLHRPLATGIGVRDHLAAEYRMARDQPAAGRFGLPKRIGQWEGAAL